MQESLNKEYNENICHFCVKCLIILNGNNLIIHNCIDENKEDKLVEKCIYNDQNFIKNLCQSYEKLYKENKKKDLVISNLERKLELKIKEEQENKINLAKEKTKSYMLALFVSKNQGLNIDDLLGNKGIQNFNSSPIISPNSLPFQQPPVLCLDKEHKDNKEKKKEHFRSINSKYINKNDQNDEKENKEEDYEENIEEKETVNNEQKVINIETIKDEYDCKINNLFKKIKQENKRQEIDKYIDEIVKIRKEYHGLFPYNIFVENLKREYDELIKIFQDKNLMSKTKQAISEKLFSKLERKIILKDIGDKESDREPINDEDIKYFRKFIFYNNIKKQPLFISTDFVYQFLTFDLSLQPIENIFKKIINMNKDIIGHLPYEKSTKEDPYCFYTLSNISEDGKKQWKLDCRLKYITQNLRDDISEYCIKLAREIYFSIFKDNHYRDNFLNANYNGISEIKQLISNLRISSNFCYLNKMFRTNVMKISSLTNKDEDKFNMTSDDKITKNEFSKYCTDTFKDEVIDSFKQLFDNINNSDSISETELYNVLMSI